MICKKKVFLWKIDTLNNKQQKENERNIFHDSLYSTNKNVSQNYDDSSDIPLRSCR